jgi:hypothetical protein
MLTLNYFTSSNLIASPVSLYRCQRERNAYNPKTCEGTTLVLSIEIYIERLFLPICFDLLDFTCVWFPLLLCPMMIQVIFNHRVLHLRLEKPSLGGGGLRGDRRCRTLSFTPRFEAWAIGSSSRPLGLSCASINFYLQTKATLTQHISLHLPDQATFFSVTSEH